MQHPVTQSSFGVDGQCLALSIALDPVSCCLVVCILVCQVLLRYAAHQGVVCSSTAAVQQQQQQWISTSSHSGGCMDGRWPACPTCQPAQDKTAHMLYAVLSTSATV